MKDIVIIYHAPCLDGFGGAFAAWKKFGESASYVPMRRSKSLPEGLGGKAIYFIDYTPTKEVTEEVTKSAKSVTILDHHIGMKEVVESAASHVFDNNRSGATIAWSYFHPTLPVPRLFTYLEDIDLWLRALPSVKEVSQFLSTQPFEFEVWEKLVAQADTEEGFEEIKKMGAFFAQYHDELVVRFVREAFLVEFEGHHIMASNAPNFFASAIAHRLYETHPPFALTWHVEHNATHVSLRGNGEVDLAELARRHGGNGHHDAAGMVFAPDAPLPFKRV